MVTFSKEHYVVSTKRHRLDDVRRILVMCGRGIGDALLTIPAISCLKRTYPAASITALAGPLSQQVLAGNEDIDRIVAFDSQSSRHRLRDLGAVLARLLSRRFDVCISFGNRPGYRAWTRIVRARYKVGRDEETPSRVFNVVDPVAFPKNTIHEVERNLRLVSLVAGVDGFRLPCINLSAGERAWAERRLRDRPADGKRRWVCLHAGGSSQHKRWPEEKYAELALRLSGLSDVRALLLYSAEESALAQAFARHTRGEIQMVCPDNVRQLAAIVNAANLLVCNDSGPMHIAAALNVPLVAIFGGTDYKRWGPVSERATLVRHDLPCWPCDAYGCAKGWPCLTQLPVDVVWRAVENALEGKHGA